MKQSIMLVWLCVIELMVSNARADMTIVADGKPMAVVVIAEDATPVAKYAAEEFAYHIKKATGAKLPIVTETENAIPDEPPGRVYIGNCQAARKADIDIGKLPPEGTALKATDRALFIAGEDGNGDPLSMNTHAGTLWGVYEVLERLLKVRWLWPGELGVYVPKTKTVKIGEVEEMIEPWLFQRNLRPGLSLRYGNEKFAFTPDGRKRYAHAQQVFLRRHRMGRSKRMRYGHAFNAWWVKYGKEHPDWFQLLEDGKRGPARPGSRFSMCVSNPGFHKKIVELWKEQKAKNPDKWININCCENDIRGLCTCERCMSWDGPQPENIPKRFGPRVVSDRYARFWLAVQQLAAKDDSEATVVGYPYVNYYPAPSPGIKLNEHIILGLVPDRFFPRDPAEHKWIKQQWAGWAATGAKLFLRPNYFLQGYCMPHIFVHQFADEFQDAARQGMVATDFDSLTGQWSTQGPNLYALCRFHLYPQRSVDDLLDEYYSAFGPAGKYVKAYFDYWEKYMTDNRERHAQIAEERRANWVRYAKMVDAIFPTESFGPAEKLLADAAKAATGQPEFAARVEFLKKGLEHAKLCAEIGRMVNVKDADVSPVAVAKARKKLLTFRRETEKDCIANFNFCASVEARSWRVPPDLYTGEEVKSLCETVQPLEGKPQISIRGAHTFLILLKEGERLTMQVAGKQVGRYDSVIEWRVFGCTDKLLAKGPIEPKKEARVDVPADEDGAYVVSVRTGRNAALVTLLNDHAVLAGRKIRLISETCPLFFYVPEGVKEFTVTLESPAPGETARMRLFNPDGKEVAVGQTGKEKTYVARVKVPPGQSGKAWSVRTERADMGTLEDYSIDLGEMLPPYWAQAADRLVIPK
ncbi:MAG: DUF4838 domain-containing protein [Planctomycetes bacterium]|nr:DUF4838 domain-containing protein [Planctomycetota bacterium]